MGLPFFERSIGTPRSTASRGRRSPIRSRPTARRSTTNGRRSLRSTTSSWASASTGRARCTSLSRGKGGKPTFDKVMRGLRTCRERGVEYNVLTTLHRANADRPVEVYRFLRDGCGARYLQFIPIIERFTGEAARSGRAGRTVRSTFRGVPNVTAGGQRRSSSALFLYRRVRRVGAPRRRDRFRADVRLTLENFYGEPGSLCVHRATCGKSLAMEHNGDVYSCDHFVEPKTSSATSRKRRWSTSSTRPSSSGSARQAEFAAASTAASATCASPATAAARRTGF